MTTIIDRKLYETKTSEWWKGKKVRTLQEMRNGWVIIAKGTICTITRKYQGFDLESDPCGTCGVQIRISRVSFWELELIE